MREAMEADPDGAEIMEQMKEIDAKMDALNEQRNTLNEEKKELEQCVKALQETMTNEELAQLKEASDQTDESYRSKRDELASLEKSNKKILSDLNDCLKK